MHNKYLANRDNYINNLKLQKNINKQEIVLSNSFQKYVARGHKNYCIKILNKHLSGEIFTEHESQYHVINGYHVFIKEAYENIDNPDGLKLLTPQMEKYLDLPPDVDILHKYLKEKLITQEKKRLLLVKQQEEEQEEKLKHLVKLEKEKEDFLLKVKSTKHTYLAISKYLNASESSLFKKATGINATFENVSTYIGLTEIQIKDLLEKERIKKEKAYLKQIELKTKKLKESEIKKKADLQLQKENHLIALNQFKGQPLDFNKIFSLYENSLTKEVLKKPQLTIYELNRYLKSPKTKKEIECEVIHREKIQALRSKYQTNSSGNIHKMHVCEILSITPTELERWKNEGLIPVTDIREFHKWGKILASEYFSPELLLSITPEMIGKWRLAKKLKDNVDDKLYKFLKSLKKQQIHYDGNWYKIIPVTVSGCEIKLRGEFSCNIDVKRLSNKSEDIIVAASEKISVDAAIKAIQKKLDTLDINKERIIRQISFAYVSCNVITATTFNNIFKVVFRPYKEISQKQEIIEALQIDKYEKSFPIARNLNRAINIVTGPTNSGKTYQALETLKKARSGVYLSPLRLLAMEIYDKLNLEGVPCNLITGEDRIVIEGAMHTASTVEMMNPDKVVEVAIIDECQMLGDKQRGWAWTAALIGVPAQEVFAISNTPALGILKKLFEKTGETYTVFEKTRLTPLETMNSLVSLDSVTKGDAIIAFSRKDVLSYATLLRKQGLKVSVIYGALSPEVRRRQSDLFCRGENEVVVATDAIGMGINLPIKRILFATIGKYDGVSVRTLESSEIHQIAGRAGRFGIYDIGYVSLLKNKVNTSHKLGQVKDVLNNQPHSYINQLRIAPNNWHIEKISKILKTTDITKILFCFSSLYIDSLFSCVNVDEMCKLHDLIKPSLKGFSLTEQYHLLCAPIEVNNESHVEFYRNLLSMIQTEQAFSIVESELYNLEQAEQKAKNLTLFCWLSFRYPKMNTDNIAEMRTKISKYIEKALVKQNMVSFSQMIEPYVRKSYRYDDSDSDYDD